MLKIFLLCSDTNHPVYAHLCKWKSINETNYDIKILSKVADIPSDGGNILFLISCSEIVKKDIRSKFERVFVLHASALPIGRGWSPHVWSILEGKTSLTLTLLEAENNVDTGMIWQQEQIELNGTELFDEINELLFCAELRLIDWACNNYAIALPREQIGMGSYYRKRTPEDSRIDPYKSISEQFDLLRVCDPDHFPAFFSFRGEKYHIFIKKD